MRRLLAHRLHGKDSRAAKLEWYSIVEGEDALWEVRGEGGRRAGWGGDAGLGASEHVWQPAGWSQLLAGGLCRMPRSGVAVRHPNKPPTHPPAITSPHCPPCRASATPTRTSSAPSWSTSTPTSCASPPSDSTTAAARSATSSLRGRASSSGGWCQRAAGSAGLLGCWAAC